MENKLRMITPKSFSPEAALLQNLRLGVGWGWDLGAFRVGLKEKADQISAAFLQMRGGDKKTGDFTF